MTTLIMLAKECVPGRVKTRLHPDLSFDAAAKVAAACIDITASRVETKPWTRKILCFDGTVLPRDFTGWEVLAQAPGGLDERIGAVLDSCTGPSVLIGMDSPHCDERALDLLSADWPPDVDAWFGPAVDGGFWALGLRRPDGGLVRGVPMSQADTGAIQHSRLRAAGLRTRILPSLRDIDDVDDLRAAADELPDAAVARFARLAPAAQLRSGAELSRPAAS